MRLHSGAGAVISWEPDYSLQVSGESDNNFSRAP
jgi:hypothetical protein